jgi:alkane 1-monooxygenase
VPAAHDLHMTSKALPVRGPALMRGAVALLLLALFTLMPLLGARLGLPWLTLAVTFVAIPLLDAWVGPPRAGRGALELPREIAAWLPRAQVPLQAVLLGLALALLPHLSTAAAIVFALAVGTVTGGIGITVAHELGHRASRLDRSLSKALLVSVGYGHFYVEHNRGHHARVATAEDPASAPRGLDVYRFMLRSVLGGFAHAWRLEAMRLRRRGSSPLHPSNWVLTGTLLWLALLTWAGLALGAAAAAFLLGQAVWAVALLEIVNYIEHYGLRRARLTDGRPEPVAPQHSWNADFMVSNWLLFNLQLHSDHHAHVERPFETLRSMSQAPQLPAGYPTMVVAALLPPLWFAVMDRRLPPGAAPAGEAA